MEQLQFFHVSGEKNYCTCISQKWSCLNVFERTFRTIILLANTMWLLQVEKG